MSGIAQVAAGALLASTALASGGGDIVERRIDTGMVTRELVTRPDSWNEERRTIDVCWTTGARGTRFDWNRFDFVDEELATEPENVRLDRLNNGAPVLNTHSRYELENQIGVVVPASARMEGGEGIATLQLSAREEVQSIVQDIASGIIRNLSVGYRVHVYEVTEREGERPVYRATDWEPYEISFVPVPFDAGAQVRSADAGQGGHPCVIRRAMSALEIDMNDRSTAGGAAAPTGTTNAATRQAEQPAASTTAATPPNAEQTRTFSATEALDFVADARSLGVEDRATELVRQNATGAIGADEAVRAMSRSAAERQRAETAGVGNGARIEVTDTNERAQRDAIVNALVARATGGQVDQNSRDYVGMSMLDLARERSGVSRSERDPDAILRAAHTTSDFPQIMEATGQRILLDRYASAAPTFTAIARRRNLRDFRPTHLLRVGDFPTLKPYLEDGEIKAGTIGEGKESVQLNSFGRRLLLTRQAIINDDIGAFDDVFGSIGVMIAQFENATFYAMKAQNNGLGPKLSDGKTVFHADHGNLGTAAAMGITGISAGRAAIRKQKNIEGQVMNLSPRTLLVGPDSETIAEQITSPLVPQQVGNVNPFAGRLDVVAEGSIPDYSYELYADPAMAAVFVFGSLESAPGPRLISKESFSVDGMQYRVTYDFYADAIDYRGAYRNPGQAPA